MSWSVSKDANTREARDVFALGHQAHPAYANDGAHRLVMDRIAEFAGDIAEAAPEGRIALNSSGYVGPDGHGSLTVTMSF